MRLSFKNRYAGLACYCCGAAAVSGEHVPAKGFFTWRYSRNLVKVPSCAEHNTAKSNQDEYTRNLICMQRKTGAEGLRKFIEKGRRGIVRNRHLMNSIEQGAGIFTEEGPTVAFAVDQKKLDSYFELLSYGIYHHSYGQRFQGHWQIIAVTFLEDYALLGYDVLPLSIKETVDKIRKSEQMQPVFGFETRKYLKCILPPIPKITHPVLSYALFFMRA